MSSDNGADGKSHCRGVDDSRRRIKTVPPWVGLLPLPLTAVDAPFIHGIPAPVLQLSTMSTGYGAVGYGVVGEKRTEEKCSYLGQNSSSQGWESYPRVLQPLTMGSDNGADGKRHCRGVDDSRCRIKTGPPCVGFLPLPLRAFDVPFINDIPPPGKITPVLDRDIQNDVYFRFGGLGIEHYNHQNGTDYEIVEFIKIDAQVVSGFVYYMTFKAKNSTDGSIATFEAKVYRPIGIPSEVLFCRKVQSG